MDSGEYTPRQIEQMKNTKQHCTKCLAVDYNVDTIDKRPDKLIVKTIPI